MFLMGFQKELFRSFIITYTKISQIQEQIFFFHSKINIYMIHDIVLPMKCLYMKCLL